MNRPLSRLATRAAYGASQLPRIAWYHQGGLRRALPRPRVDLYPFVSKVIVFDKPTGPAATATRAA